MCVCACVRACVCMCVSGQGVVFEKQLGHFTPDVRKKVFIVQKVKCSSMFLLHLVNLDSVVCTVSSSVSCVAYVVHWYGKSDCLLCGDVNIYSCLLMIVYHKYCP